MPDGKSLAFVGQDTQGAWGIFLQPFLPGSDTSKNRRPLSGFDRDYFLESFGIAPDGKRITLSSGEAVRSLMIAEGLPGVFPPVRTSR
jgi:hypothetical protein